MKCACKITEISGTTDKDGSKRQEIKKLIQKLKETYLEVLSTDEDDSFEKTKNNHINKKTFNSILEELQSPKKYFEGEPRTPSLKPKGFQRVNSIQKNSISLKKNILEKNYIQPKLKERKKSSYSRLLSLPTKYRNIKLIKKEKMEANNNLNISKNNLTKSNKNINKIILNGNEKRILKNQKNNSSTKLIINKITVDNKNFESEAFNRLEKTPERNKIFNRINKYKLKANLPYVTKLENNFIKSTNKKISTL